MKFAAIIVAAGSSRRMGFDKLLADLAGQPVLQHCIEAFLSCSEITHVIVVCPSDRYEALDFEFSNKVVQRVDGGNDRHDSVAAGIAVLPEDIDYIAVHDGARPLISGKQIQRVLQEAISHGAATSARPVTETVKRATDGDMVSESVSRDDLWLMETPQIFHSSLLIRAYEQVAKSGARVTDEVSAMELIDQPVKLVANDGVNPKITYPADIEQALKHF